MSARRTIFMLVVAGIFAAAVYDGWLLLSAPKHVLPGTLDARGAYKHTETTDLYKIEASYPNRTALWRWWDPGPDMHARSIMENWLAGDIAQFKKEVISASSSGEGISRIPDSGGYSYEETYKHYLHRGMPSYQYDVDVYTGGAHDINYFKTFVFNGQGQEVRLSNLFTPGSDYLERIASSSLVQISKDLQTRVGADAAGAIFMEGLAPKDSNFSNFVIDNDMLLFFFPPYQVAAYAAGDFEVRIPLSDLTDILQPEWKN